MKFLSTILIFVFLLSCTTSAQEKKNPLAGTTWDLTSMKNVREDTTTTFPNSPSDQAIMIFGKTHYSFVHQDTSRDANSGSSFTYKVDGDNFTAIPQMYNALEAIGKPVKLKFKIEGDQLFFEATDWHFGGHDYKSFHQVWKRID